MGIQAAAIERRIALPVVLYGKFDFASDMGILGLAIHGTVVSYSFVTGPELYNSGSLLMVKL